MKKLLSILLAVTLIISICPLGLFSITASAATSGYYTYTVTNNKATITSVSPSISGNITIPVTLGGYTVMNIGDSAFSGCNLLTSVVIPDSITTIGTSAFYNCSSLTSITIPNRVTSIGESAFRDCSALEKVVIPSSVQTVGEMAFQGCTNLSTVIIEKGIKELSKYMFGYCDSLKSIIIPDSVNTIRQGAFASCDNLSVVFMPDSVTIIEQYAFATCINLSDVWHTYSRNCISINNTKNSNDYLINATWHYNACKTTHSYSNDCDTECNKCGWTRITSHLYDDDYDITCDICGNVRYYTYTISNGKATIIDCDEAISGDIIIPDTLGGYPVASIGRLAFYNCTLLTSVTIPDGVGIGEYAFDDCTSLTSVNIPIGITTIPDGAFMGTNLTRVEIPSTVKTIGVNAFTYCPLEEIVIPGSVNTIGSYAFAGCDKLEHVWYSGTSTSKYNMDIFNNNSALTNAEWHFICTGSHSYENACDTTCSECDWKREVPDHSYDENKQCEHCGYKLGDINCDGNVNAADLADLKKRLAGLLNTTEMEGMNFDVDGNGLTNAADLADLKKMLAGLL